MDFSTGSLSPGFAWLGAVVLTVFAGGVRGGDDDGPAPASADPPPKPRLTVGLIQADTKSPWKAAQTKSILRAAQKRGIGLQIVDAMGRQDAQVKALYEFISQDVDAVVVSPAAAEGWDAVLGAAGQAGVAVVFLDRGVKCRAPGLGRPVVRSSPEKQGGRVAAWLVKKMPDGGQIAVLGGDEADARAAGRRKGFEDALKDDKNVDLVAGPRTGGARLEGKKAALALLNRPGRAIDALFAASEPLALGAIQAIEEAGRTGILVVTIGGSREAIEAIRAGRLGATLDRNHDCGAALLGTVEKLCAGREVSGEIEPLNLLFDASNTTEYTLEGRPY